MTVNILPCPFCGKTPSLKRYPAHDSHNKDVFEINCCVTMSTSVSMRGTGDKEIENFVLNKWNSRPMRDRFNDFVDKETWDTNSSKFDGISDSMIYNVFVEDDC